MSGNWIEKIENMNVCPTCEHDAQICYIEKIEEWEISINTGTKEEPKLETIKVPALEIKFHHPEITNSANPKWLCEAQEESGGYTVRIPLCDAKDIIGRSVVEDVSQEWY